MFSDGLNPAKGSAVRVLKNHLFFARRGKNEKEKIKLYNGFSLLQVRLGVGMWVGRQSCARFPAPVLWFTWKCVCLACWWHAIQMCCEWKLLLNSYTQFKGDFGAWLTVSMRLIQSHLCPLPPPYSFLLYTSQPIAIKRTSMSAMKFFSTPVQTHL